MDCKTAGHLRYETGIQQYHFVHILEIAEMDNLNFRNVFIAAFAKTFANFIAASDPEIKLRYSKFELENNVFK